MCPQDGLQKRCMKRMLMDDETAIYNNRLNNGG